MPTAVSAVTLLCLGPNGRNRWALAGEVTHAATGVALPVTFALALAHHVQVLAVLVVIMARGRGRLRAGSNLGTSVVGMSEQREAHGVVLGVGVVVHVAVHDPGPSRSTAPVHFAPHSGFRLLVVYTLRPYVLRAT